MNSNNRLLAAALLVISFCVHGKGLADDRSDGSNALVLPPPTHKVVFRNDLRFKHPRVFFDSAELEAFRKMMDKPAVAPMAASFLHVADEIAAESPPDLPPNQWQVRKVGHRLPRIAFAYLITRNPRYLDGARKWIHAVLKYPKWDTDIDLGASEVTFGMAVAYDWLYADLSAAEREQMEAALLRHGRLLLQRSSKAPDSYWGDGYFVSYCVINHTGISTAAMALYDINPNEMQGWLDYTRSKFQPTYSHLPLDGGYHEGAPHLTFAAAACMRYIESLRSISGEDLGDMPYLQNLTKRILDIMVMPDGRSLANFGDSDVAGVSPDDEIYAWLGSRQKDGHAEWLRQKMRSQFVPARPVDSPFALIWFDPSLAAKAPDDLPPVGLYADLGDVAFRSSWKDDAAVVVFRCGPPGGHYIAEHTGAFPACAFNGIHYNPDANTFLFWSDKQFQIGDPAGYTLDKQTHAENIWMVGGKGQRGGDRKWFDPKSYLIPGIAQPHLVRVATSPTADYVIGEAAPAYEPECSLSEFKRHLLFVKEDKPYVVVYDRLRAKEPKSWVSYLHTFGKIDVADNQSFSAVGAPPPSHCFGVVLGPAGVTLDAHRLNVLGFFGNKPADRGFELATRLTGTTEAAWLVTVIGTEKSQVTLGGSERAPSITVGKDLIAWDASSNVSLNGKPVEGNLLPATP